MKNKKLNILVTGGSGFLGSHVVDSLESAGHNVIIFDSKKSANIKSGSDFINPEAWEGPQSRVWVLAIDATQKKKADAKSLVFKALQQAKQWPDFVTISLLEASSQLPPSAEFAPIAEKFTTKSDPHMRAMAFRALLHHDRAQYTLWLKRALADGHFFVRHQAMQTLSPPAAARIFGEEEVVKYLHQLEAYTERNILPEDPPKVQ